MSKWAYDSDDAQDILIKYQEYSRLICDWNQTQFRAGCKGSFEIR